MDHAKGLIVLVTLAIWVLAQWQQAQSTATSLRFTLLDFLDSTSRGGLCTTRYQTPWEVILLAQTDLVGCFAADRREGRGLRLLEADKVIC